MRRLILAAALFVIAGSTVWAQGKITIGNDSNRPLYIGMAMPGDAPGVPLTTPLPSGYPLELTLYAGTVTSSLMLQTAFPLSAVSGVMAPVSVLMSGVPPSAPAYFSLVITSGGQRPSTVDGAMITANSGMSTLSPSHLLFPGTVYYGSSGLFTAVPSASAYPPIYQILPPVNSTWPAGTIWINAVPEPSAFALTGLGAFSLWILRRRR